MDNNNLTPLDDNEEELFSSINRTQSDEDYLIIDEPKNNEIKNKESNFVLLFGSAETGKSVILSSLLYYLKSKQGVLEINPNRIHSQGDRRLISDLLDKIKKGELPERTTIDQVAQLDFIFKPNNKSKKVRPIELTFLETAGDNNYAIRRGGKFHNSLDNYLNEDISLTIILVTSYQNAHKEDTFIDEFLNALKEKTNILKLNIILVISKWDLSGKMRISNEQELDNFIEKRLPMTYSAVNTYKMAKTYYTIGEIKEKDGTKKVSILNLERAEKLSKWLYKSITGYSLDYEGTFWERIKYSFSKDG